MGSGERSLPWPLGCIMGVPGRPSRCHYEGAMLVAASYLAENARPVYERIAAYVGQRLGEPAELIGTPWAERFRLLDGGGVDVAFLCGLPYSHRADRLELLGAPVMAAPRYPGPPVHFTGV